MALSTRRRRVIAQRYLAIQRRHQLRLERTLRRFFTEQARRVLRRFNQATKVATEELFPEEERVALQRVMLALLIQAWLDAGGFMGDLVAAQEIESTDPRIQLLMTEAGVRITGIHAETRRSIRDVLVEGTARGYSDYQIAHGVPKEGFRGLSSVVQETYRGRAETIARTEIALASNAAAADQYEQARVSEVDIADGPHCGWRRHSDPDKANNTRRTLIDFRQHSLAHPNCRRVPLPVVGR